jgi:hypothetical protein
MNTYDKAKLNVNIEAYWTQTEGSYVRSMMKRFIEWTSSQNSTIQILPESLHNLLQLFKSPIQL